MADTAFMEQFRRETIMAFEARQSLVRGSVTTEAVINGNEATFLVAGSGGATAVTRGVNGDIPSRPDDLTQTTATLTEWHDVPEKTGFNIFASQGNQRAIMQMTCVAVMNRKTDDQIITELNTATNDTGAATQASINLVAHAQAILGNNEVPSDGNLWALITPAFRSYLIQTPEFASADYVTKKPYDGANTMWRDMQGFYRWLEVNWIVHPNLPGVGTAAEKCFMYHTNSIGHAMDSTGMKIVPGYIDRHDKSFVRCTAFMGAKLLQNSGVVVMNHDGSGFVAS